MGKFVINKYKDGAIIASAWDEYIDGPWPFGDEDEHIINREDEKYWDE